ncbi:MAG TPA: TIGR03560 family F420-dependent LLM class oxidoreductase [Candidatus Limnocylindrales bacterium]|nr:TIGR03560 family F420-dependent LLM class oxidoreductase [Candidatus Limnocylindrales bacterium]
MKIGVIVPQGWTGEYAGFEPVAAWRRTVEVAQEAEELGFESLWLFDHFHTTPDPTDELTFEAFTTLSALAALTRRVRLGHIVSCASYRNPALQAKMISTLDTISGGRMELGIGAGWKREEWEAYGYDFPETPERLKILEESLEVITRMFEPGRASFDGVHTRIAGAINLPKPIQKPRVPIMVGGNGRKVTWRLAAQFADEINLDNMPPDELPGAMKDIAAHCEAVGRDPQELRVSVHIWWEALENGGSPVDLIRAYREAGVSRVMALVRSAATDADALRKFRDDAERAGAELDGATADRGVRAATEREAAAVGD